MAGKEWIPRISLPSTAIMANTLPMNLITAYPSWWTPLEVLK